jgi:hypothetical protein
MSDAEYARSVADGERRAARVPDPVRDRLGLLGGVAAELDDMR